MMTSEEIAARTERALRTVSDAARALGIAVNAPRLLYNVFSVVVELPPAALVARAPVVLPHGLGAAAQYARQQRELEAAAWLAERGLPVVRPSPLVPRVPVQRDGLSITFWERVEVVTTKAGAADPMSDIELLPLLHAELREYPGELPFLSPIAIGVPALLEYLERHPALVPQRDLDRALREWAVLRPLLSSRASFQAAFPNALVQPIHGDAPSYNMICTPNGRLFADFEDVTLGPVEWDLAMFGVEAADRYDAAARSQGLPTLDRDVLRLMDSARMLQLVACLALSPQLPALAHAMSSWQALWHSSPFAGGVAEG